MKLKYIEKTVRSVDYSDLEDFICKQYGVKEFNICCDQEWGNSEDHEISIKKEELDVDELEDIENFKRTGKSQFLLRDLLTDLCNKDLIEPGDYLIEIFW